MYKRQAAIEDMETADLLCVIYVTGIKNNELREKLLEINHPTVEKFERESTHSTRPRSSWTKCAPQPPWPLPNRPEEGSSRETRGKTTTAARKVR